MKNWLRTLGRNNTETDRFDRAHLAQLLNRLLKIALISSVLFLCLVLLPFMQFGRQFLQIGLFAPVIVLCMVLLRRQKYDLAVWILLLSAWAIFISVTIVSYGISGPLILGSMLLILLGANAFLSHRAAYFFLGLITLTDFVLALAQVAGRIPAHQSFLSPISVWIAQTFFLVLAQLLMSDTILLAREAFTHAQHEREERRKLEDLYRRAIRTAEGVPYAFDFAAQQYTFIGEGIESLTGYKREEFNRQVFLQMIQHAELRGDLAGSTIEEMVPRILAGEYPEWHGDYRIRTKNGDTRWLSHSAILVSNDAQQPTGSIGILLDITDRKMAEASRAESENRFQAIVENSAAGIVLMDLDGRLLTTNPAMRRFLGYSENELLNFRVSEITHPEDLPAELAQVDKLRRGDLPYFQSEKRFIRKDGTSVWARMTASLVINAQTQLGFGLMIVDDISLAKQAEAALQERDAILEAVVFAAEAFLKQPDWRVSIGEVLAMLGRETHASHAYIFENHTGPAGEPVTSMRYEWTNPGGTAGIDWPEFQNVPLPWPGVNNWQETLRAGEAYIGSNERLAPGEINLNALLGIQSYVDVPILFGDCFWGIIGFGDPTGNRAWSDVEIDALKIAASVLSAAIQRQQTDEEIRRLNTGLEQRVRTRTAELEASNRELESFAYSVSHDLRAPLRAIDGYGKLLSMDYSEKLDDNAAEMLENMRQATSKMNHLIDDLLKLSRITRSQMNVEEVCLSDIAAGILEQLRSAEPDRIVKTQVMPGVLVQGDANLLQVALENLLRNAWKFTNRVDTANIEFGVQNGPDGRVFYIRDNGAGFNMLYAEKLFIPFQRLHGEDEFEGTGVGLATVRRIIQRHNGRIWPEAEPGKGATFYFTIR